MALEQCLTRGIVRAGDRTPVPRGAVGFQDDPGCGPPEAGDDAAPLQDERDVDQRVLEPAARDQVEDDVLQLASASAPVRRPPSR